MIQRSEESSRRSTPFSYRCQGCCRCCYGKRIPVSPYEVARLAEARAITTTELLNRHVEPGAPFLAREDDDSCTFLGPEGCTVHRDRPLACRLYPLGRIVSGDKERFVHLTPHPESEGEYGDDGTIDAYLESQGVRPFLQTADRLYSALIELSERGDSAGPLGGDADPVGSQPRVVESRIGDPSVTPTSDGQWILDVDAIVERACQERDLEMPTCLDERFGLYIETLSEGAAGPGS